MKNFVIEGQSLTWLLVASTDATVIIDSEGRIVLANPALERLFGYDHDALLGEPIEVLVPARFVHAHGGQRTEYFKQPRARSMGSGAALSGLHRDGREFSIEVSLSPLHTGQGLPLAMATIHDITRRKQAEAALQESEARMRAIFETAVDAIITIDDTGRLERLNDAAERMFGYAEAEVAGKSVAMLMPLPHREMHDVYLARLLDTGDSSILGSGREVEGLRKDGTVFPMDLTVAEMRLGERRMFTGMARDITERKLSEASKLRLVEELTSANEELTSFAYVVSHDLKAPLRGIGSLADWIATDDGDKFSEEGKEHMRLLIQRVHRMGAMIDGILQYSRVGRVREAVAPVDLNGLLPKVIDLLAPPSGIVVRVETALPAVVAEPTRMAQVFHNLVSNAIKYMGKPDGVVRIGCADHGHDWHFYVADDGPGIDPRHFDKVFQLFQTLAPRDRVESTGVGLALVKKIVEMYHGRIWIESAPGAGTTFCFTIPKNLPADVATLKG